MSKDRQPRPEDLAWVSIEPLLPRSGARRAMARSSAGDQWDLVEGAHGSALAESAGAVWSVADLRRSALSLATRGSLGSHPHAGTGHIGCGGRGGLGGEHRQFHGARSSPRQWSSASAESDRRTKGIAHPPDDGHGRSRGGLTTKFHLACDGKGRPLSIVITPGQRHDSPQLSPVLDSIRVPRPRGRGRARRRPDHLIADKGYSYAHCRDWLRRRQISHTIPERRDQRAHRARRPGRLLAFDQATYKRRNVVKRCINRLKQWRGLATRFEKGQSTTGRWWSSTTSALTSAMRCAMSGSLTPSASSPSCCRPTPPTSS